MKRHDQEINSKGPYVKPEDFHLISGFGVADESIRLAAEYQYRVAEIAAIVPATREQAEEIIRAFNDAVAKRSARSLTSYSGSDIYEWWRKQGNAP